MRRDELKAQIESGDADHKRAMAAIAAIESILGETAANQDDLIDQWEADLEAGRIPDLE